MHYGILFSEELQKSAANWWNKTKVLKGGVRVKKNPLSQESQNVINANVQPYRADQFSGKFTSQAGDVNISADLDGVESIGREWRHNGGDLSGLLSRLLPGNSDLVMGGLARVNGNPITFAEMRGMLSDRNLLSELPAQVQGLTRPRVNAFLGQWVRDNSQLMSNGFITRGVL